MEHNAISYEEWLETNYGKESVPIVKNLMDDGIIDGFIGYPVAMINGEVATASSRQLKLCVSDYEYFDVKEALASFKADNSLYLLSMKQHGGYAQWKTYAIDSETFEKTVFETPRFKYVAPKLQVRCVVVPNE